jgi:type I restriction enzyme S subunit
MQTEAALRSLIPFEKDWFVSARGKVGGQVSSQIDNSSGPNTSLVLNQRVGVLRARNINQSFLSYILQSEGFTKSIELLCYGGAQENIGKNEIGSIITTVPPTQEQHAIIAFLENEILTINSLIAKATQEITLIKEYREALIAEAVTGKIDVRGWRKQRGKAA